MDAKKIEKFFRENCSWHKIFLEL